MVQPNVRYQPTINRETDMDIEQMRVEAGRLLSAIRKHDDALRSLSARVTELEAERDYLREVLLQIEADPYDVKAVANIARRALEQIGASDE